MDFVMAARIISTDLHRTWSGVSLFSIDIKKNESIFVDSSSAAGDRTRFNNHTEAAATTTQKNKQN